MTRVAIIGAGAAGCFCGAQLLSRGARVTLFEAGAKPLAKVAITGGGRCNLSNTFAGIRSLGEAYPRGERVMQRALKAFSQEDACRWFSSHGVPVTVQPDACVFPVSQDARDVVRALLDACKGADFRLRHRVQSIQRCPVGAGHDKSVIPDLIGYLVDGEPFDAVVVTTGGAPQGLPFLKALDLEMVPPVPSLFTFNLTEPRLRELMGLVVTASLAIPGTAFRSEGPLLITDWGLSGPATLRLSSYAARYLAENQYKAPLLINWLNLKENQMREQLSTFAKEHSQQRVTSARTSLPARLWGYLAARAGLREDLRWAELGSKGLNRLTATLTADEYRISGKCKFRDEFVTAGGVALGNLHLSTLESKAHPGLFFAGEVLDIDAITGGFNLQAAWSTGFVAAQNIRV